MEPLENDLKKFDRVERIKFLAEELETVLGVWVAYRKKIEDEISLNDFLSALATVLNAYLKKCGVKIEKIMPEKEHYA